jgi:hypothetical protein
VAASRQLPWQLMQASLAKGCQRLFEVAASFDKSANLTIAAHTCSIQQLFCIA